MWWMKDMYGELTRGEAESMLRAGINRNIQYIVAEPNLSLNEVLAELGIEDKNEPILGKWLTRDQIDTLMNGIEDMSNQSLLALLSKIGFDGYTIV